MSTVLRASMNQGWANLAIGEGEKGSGAGCGYGWYIRNEFQRLRARANVAIVEGQKAPGTGA